MPTHTDSTVRKLRTGVYRVPTDAPEADGTLHWDATTMVTVQVFAGDAMGLGWTFAPRAAATVIDDTLAPVVTGRDVHSISCLYEDMSRAVRNQGRTGIAACAISAVDVALWDLAARLHGEPLSGLLGRCHDAAPIYGSGGFTSYDADQLDAQLVHWVDDLSIPRVKIKIGEAWGTREERDLERIRQARARIGETPELYVDANGAYGVAQAIRVLHRARDARITWYEEPVSSDDLEGLAAVRAGVDADVAAGEYGWDIWTLRRLCSSGAVDCLQVDATRCGGVTGWLRAATVAAAHGLEVSAHCAPQLHAHLAVATTNLRHVEYFHDHVRIVGLCFDGALDPAGGTLWPHPDTPGHGMSLRRDDADAFRVA